MIPAVRDEGQQVRELAAGAHRRADHPQLQEEQSLQVGPGVRAAGRTGDDDRAARLERPHRVGPGRLADGLEHRVHPSRQPGPGRERGVRAQPLGHGALGVGASGHPHLHAGRVAELDQRRRDATGGALHQHGLPGAEPGLHEQHPVGRQPRRTHHGGLRHRQPGRLGDGVARRHHHRVGERPLVLLGEQRALRVEGLVTGDAGVADHRMQHDLGAVGEPAGAVAAQDHRELVGLDADTAQRPQVVHVQARRSHVHRDPPVRDLGLGALPDGQRLQRLVGVGLGCVDGEHFAHASRKVPRPSGCAFAWPSGSGPLGVSLRGRVHVAPGRQRPRSSSSNFEVGRRAVRKTGARHDVGVQDIQYEPLFPAAGREAGCTDN